MKEFKDGMDIEGPVVLKFYADWCGPCKMLKPMMEKVMVDTTDISFLAVNVDETKLAEDYGVMSLPTTVLLDSEGKEVARKTGFMPEPQIREFIKQIQ